MRVHKIFNVKNYILVKGQIFTSDDNRVIFEYSNNKIFDSENFDTASLMSIDEFLIVPITPRRTFIFDSDKNVEKSLEGSCIFKKYKSKKIILKFSNADYSSFQIKIYDLQNHSFEFEIKHNFSLITSINHFGDFLYLANKNLDISSFHLPTETTMWQYSAADLGAEKVTKILGVFGEVLVVVGVSGDRIFVLFGLDVNSGALVWKHDKVFEPNGVDPSVKLQVPWADTENNRIIIFEKSHYIEIQGSTGHIHKWINVYKTPLTYQDVTVSEFSMGSVDEDYIYFRASVHNYGMYTWAGIFNRHTDTIEFMDLILSEKGNPVSVCACEVKVTKEKFYVLDVQNTLHIYDRELSEL